MDKLKKILRNYLNKGSEKIDVTMVLSLIDQCEKDSDEQLFISRVSNRLLAEKIILALDDYGRKTHSVEYGLPIDPDTKDFEDKRPQEMLKIVTDILNGC